MKTGRLTNVERRQLREIHNKALELAEIVLNRLLQDEQGQNDKHVNAWWRHYDEKMDSIQGSIQIHTEAYLHRQT